MVVDHYLTLGVTRDATSEEIAQAFERERRSYRIKGLPWISLLYVKALTRKRRHWLAVKEAFAILSDPEQRDVYDERLRSSRE